MGLDMYMYKRTYVGAEYSHRDIKGEIDLTRKGKRIPIVLNRVTEIVEQIGYWRKFNALHGWIVNNCADGIDECQRIYLSEENMDCLKDVIQKTLDADDIESAVAENLPPTSGFFFGDGKIDEWFIQDLKDTLAVLEGMSYEDSDVSYEYQASW